MIYIYILNFVDFNSNISGIYVFPYDYYYYFHYHSIKVYIFGKQFFESDIGKNIYLCSPFDNFLG